MTNCWNLWHLALRKLLLLQDGLLQGVICLNLPWLGIRRRVKCPSFFSRIFILRVLILRLLRIENAALMRPWGMSSSLPSERLSSSSMDSWPYSRILGAQIVAGSYYSDSSNSLLTCYGSPSDDFLALHHPLHNGPRSTSLCLPESNPGSTRSYDMFLYCTGYLLVASSCLGLFTNTLSHYKGKPPRDAPNEGKIVLLHPSVNRVCTWVF